MATIEKATLTLSVETITWQECKRLVDECNGNNRNISVRHVNRLSRDARAGRWPLTHQGIALDHNGHVIDGQHRLAAHAMAQRDLTTVVCRYKSALAAQEAMIIIDSGRARGTADALAVSGVVKKEIARDAVAVCVLMDLVLSDPGSIGGDVRFYMGDFYRAHREAVDWAVSAASERRFTAPMRAAFAIGWKIDSAATSEFVAQVREGVAAPGTAAALWLRLWTDGQFGKGSGTRRERTDACLRALRIVKAHIEREKTPSKIYVTDETAKWAKAALGGGPVKTKAESAPVQAEDTMQTKVLKVLSRGGAWAIPDIVQEVKGKHGYVAGTLMQLTQLRRIKRVGRGVYALSEVAA